MFVVKYNSVGNALWAKCVGAPNNIGNIYSTTGYSVATDFLENVFVTGSFSSTVSFDSISLSFPACIYKYCDPMFIAKYNSNGNALCVSALISGGDDYNSVAVDKFGNAYVGGDFLDSLFIVGADTVRLGIPNGGGTLPENIFVAKYKSSNASKLAISTTSTIPLCHSQCNGKATAIPSGCSTYSYKWSNGQTAQTATGLCAGNYTVTVTDVKGLSSTSTVTISEPTAITLTTTNVSSCSGNSMGSATVNPNGGTAGYVFGWNNGQKTQSISGLSAGTYIVTVTDANGCIDTTSVKVATLPGPTVYITGNSAVCKGQNTTLIASGGGTYKWNTGDITSSITVLPVSATSYYVTVTDVNGCSGTNSQTVTVNPNPTVNIAGGGTFR